jgi:glycosyltransferase involved in cell wall biosynthesis
LIIVDDGSPDKTSEVRLSIDDNNQVIENIFRWL